LAVPKVLDQHTAEVELRCELALLVLDCVTLLLVH
jgi:hypothetical protein